MIIVPDARKSFLSAKRHPSNEMYASMDMGVIEARRLTRDSVVDAFQPALSEMILCIVAMHSVVLFTIPDVVQLTMPITLKRTASIPSFCNSSDTEPLETPPRKRTRLNHDHSPGSTSSSMTLRTSSSASRTCIELFQFLSLIPFLATSRSRRKPARESDFELRDILRRCAATPVSHAAIRDLKSFPKGEFFIQYKMAKPQPD